MLRDMVARWNVWTPFIRGPKAYAVRSQSFRTEPRGVACPDAG